MKDITIVFIHNIEYPQQWAIDIFYYSKYLSKYNNYNIKVICKKINEDISNNNLEIIELWNINYFIFILKTFFKINNINKKHKIKYVYFFSQNPFSVLLQFLVKYLLNINTIYDIISWPIWKWIVPFISKITIKLWVYLSDKYIIDHKGLYNNIWLSKNKPNIVIGIGYDDISFYPNKNVDLFNKKKNEIIFTYIWTLNKERNLDIFIKAFVKNLEINKNIKLYFIWYGNWEKILKDISWDYLNKNIFFLWKKEHKEIPNYINSSDIMVSYIPKVDYFEYQPPTKLIEYLACNKPVIVTNTIAQKEIMNWFKDLLHFDDFESTKNKIKYFIENINFIRKKQFYKLVNKFTWKELVTKEKELIES